MNAVTIPWSRPVVRSEPDDTGKDATVTDVDCRQREQFCETVEAILRLRARRALVFGQALFADPAWDILLDLAVATVRDNKLSVSAVCSTTAGCSHATSVRCIARLEQAGLVERTPDDQDRRRYFLRLSSVALTKMRAIVQNPIGTVACNPFY